MLVSLQIQRLLPMTIESLLKLKSLMTNTAIPISDNTHDYYSDYTFNVTSTQKKSRYNC